MCENGKVFGVSCDSYTLQGAMCEYIAVPEHIVYRIPENISFEQASLIEPLSIALHGVNNTPICLNDTAVIFGAGTIGILILKLLKQSSCGRVVIVDIDEVKLKKAKEIGADLCLQADKVDVVESIREITGGKGADVALEAVGINSTFNNALNCIKKGGALTMIGNVSPKLDFPLQKAVVNEIKLYGSYGCSVEYETAIDMLAAGRVDVTDCISAVAPLSEGQEWFDRLHAGEKGLLKVVLLPN